VFAVKLDNTEETRDYVAKLSESLHAADLVRNPFRGEILTWKTSNTLYSMIWMEPIYISFLYIAAVIGMISLGAIVFGLMKTAIVFAVIGLLFCAAEYFRTDKFFFSVMKFVLGKKGYFGRIERMKLGDFIVEVALVTN